MRAACEQQFAPVVDPEELRRETWALNVLKSFQNLPRTGAMQNEPIVLFFSRKRPEGPRLDAIVCSLHVGLGRSAPVHVVAINVEACAFLRAVATENAAVLAETHKLDTLPFSGSIPAGELCACAALTFVVFHELAHLVRRHPQVALRCGGRANVRRG